MKYSLRSLMIAVLVLPPLLAVGWFVATILLGEREIYWGDWEHGPDFIIDHRPWRNYQAPAPNPPKP